MIMIYAAVIGYLLGTVNPAYLFGRMKGIDIRTQGTMSAGASNAKVVLGWKYFVMTLIYDAGKAALAMAITYFVLKGTDVDAAAAGAAAVIGHCYPFYLGFRGGKGFASYIGMAAVLNIYAALILAVIGLGGSFLANYIVVATLTFVIGLPICLIWFAPAAQGVLISVCLASAVILWKHRVNFVKLMNGEEIGINGKKIGFKKAE